MLLHDSRRDARLDEAGDLVVLEEQDRSRWDQRQIAEALPLVEEALRGGPGPFALQAAIAALHCQAARAEDTDWPQIVRLYDLLERAAALAHRVAEPRGGGRDGGRPAAGARAHRCARRRPAISTTITCCMPRAPICCAALGSLGGSGEELRASAGAGHQRQRAPVSRAAAARSSAAGNVTRFLREAFIRLYVVPDVKRAATMAPGSVWKARISLPPFTRNPRMVIGEGRAS